MSVYLDIGAKHIQAYLARTPRLKARRGASALLDHELLRESTKIAWRKHAVVNTEGKCTDGVLSLVFTDPQVPDAEVDTVVAEIVVRLNRVAPGAQWELRISRVPAYPDADRAAADAEARGLALLSHGEHRVIPVPPAPAEVPVVRFCECCGVDPAVRRKVLEAGTDPVPLCADCTRRLFEGGNRTDDHNWAQPDAERQWAQRIRPGGLRAEHDLMTAVTARTGTELGLVEEFHQLAALGRGDANHLCTVSVDGNRFGELLATLKDIGVSPYKLSKALTKAVGQAVVEATVRVLHDRDTALPVVPHLIGGDDLLVSVTADRAWDFVIAFLDCYHARTRELVAEYGHPDLQPTASAGLVFAHTAFPFATAVDLAEQALRHAKAQHRAARPALCWVDVTEDGPVLPPHRGAPALHELAAHRADLDRLLKLPPAGQAELGRVAHDPERTLALAYRLGYEPIIRPFDQPSSFLSIADALVLGRWWKCRQPD